MDLIMPGVGLIFWMTLVFSLLLILLKKFAWKPIMDSLREREQDISSSLAMAKQTKAEMKQLQADNEKLLQLAREERDVILNEAKTTKDQIISEAKDKAQAEADRIVESARVNIENEKRAALTEIKTQVAELSIEIAEKVLKAELSNKTEQNKLVEKQLENLNFN
ncbi:MAG: ATP synthase F0 subunit B [Bacteroidetes bacterium 4572_112]|nr:MAG: ATP synthase F0 subunit B [Bacteroidetes bacterium 4572_112]